MAAHTDSSRRATADVHRLFVRYGRDGDLVARDALVGGFLPLARHLVQRYGRENRHAEDLFQVASMGLAQSDRSLRSRARERLHHVRGADDPR